MIFSSNFVLLSEHIKSFELQFSDMNYDTNFILLDYKQIVTQ